MGGNSSSGTQATHWPRKVWLVSLYWLSTKLYSLEIVYRLRKTCNSVCCINRKCTLVYWAFSLRDVKTIFSKAGTGNHFVVCRLCTGNRITWHHVIWLWVLSAWNDPSSTVNALPTELSRPVAIRYSCILLSFHPWMTAEWGGSRVECRRHVHWSVMLTRVTLHDDDYIEYIYK